MKSSCSELISAGRSTVVILPPHTGFPGLIFHLQKTSFKKVNLQIIMYNDTVAINGNCVAGRFQECV
jgi:hypothetical protein